MEEQQVGWIAAIIIGGIAGWLAEQFMKSQMGLLMNIVLGIIGAAVASWLFGFLGIAFAGWIGYLIAGFIGACNPNCDRTRVHRWLSAANMKSRRRQRRVGDTERGRNALSLLSSEAGRPSRSASK
jgi:uncharacterized membrane protein YeaQ/YmgE (transglycosylase-associated protein family)